jgi:probable F420-dependent oxidoreductase
MGTDPIVARDYAQAAESLGYNHLLAFDHVVGANAASRPGWSGAYQHTDSFYEPFVLFGYLAGVTDSIELVSGIVILPQRQTVLVAKQAATVDVLSGGRLRLGIGTGWNAVEYEALGESFHNRGRRSEEQIELMRALWTNELVTYEGRWHKITDAGINPLPVRRPIPLWIGGGADPVVRRIGRLADGWMLPGTMRTPEQAAPAIDAMRDHARRAGRDPDQIGLQRVVSGEGPAEWADAIREWLPLGVTHFAVAASGPTPDAQFEKMWQFREVVSEVGG